MKTKENSSLMNEKMKRIFNEKFQFVGESRHRCSINNTMIGRPTDRHQRSNATRRRIFLLVARTLLVFVIGNDASLAERTNERTNVVEGLFLLLRLFSPRRRSPLREAKEQEQRTFHRSKGKRLSVFVSTPSSSSHCADIREGKRSTGEILLRQFSSSTQLL